MMACVGHVSSHVIIVFLLFLVVIASWATGPIPFQEIGRVTRPDPFVFEGATLVLFCNITNAEVRENSSLMYFDRSTDVYTGPIPDNYTEILSTRTIRLRLPDMKLTDQGTYTCKQKLPHPGSRVRVIGHQVVTVDYHLKAVENVSCIVYNWQRMACTWDLGRKYQNPENVNVSLVWTIFGNQADCPHLTKTSCTWGQKQYTHGHVYKLLVELKYIIHDKVLETANSKIMNIQTKLLIKPDPAIDFRATEINSTCITLHWDHSQAVDRRDELFFIAQYKSQWSPQWNAMPTLQGEFKTQVCHLVPFTKYVFKMYVLPPPEYSEDDSQGYSSAATNVTVMTKEDVPGSQPSLCPGCFYCRDSKLCESATIYWQALPESQRHGTITKYKFSLRNGTQEISVKTKSGIDLYSTTLELPAKLPLVEVRVTAGTNVGFALRSSDIIIPTAHMRPSPPSQFLVQTMEGKDKLFYLSWPASPNVGDVRNDRKKSDKEVTDMYKEKGREKMTGLTIVWCLGSRMAFDCEGDIQWERLAADRVTYELDLRKTDAHKERILIGIIREVTRGGQVLSSGIHWADCVHLADRKPSGPPKHVRFPKEQSPSKLYVVWDKMDCGQERAYITEYHVMYCLSNNESGCTSTVRMKNVSSQLGEAVLQNLQPGKMYMVQVRAVSSAGYGQYSLPVVREVAVPSKDNGQEQSKQIVIAVGVAVAVLFLVITIAFLFWRCQRRKKKLEMDDIQPYAEISNRGSNENRPLFRKSESSDDNGSVHSHHPLINGCNKSINVKFSPKSEVPLLSFRGTDKMLSDNDELQKPFANSSLVNSKHWKRNSSDSSNKLGNINEERDSGTVVDSRGGSDRSAPRHSGFESSSGGTDEYHKITEVGDDVSSENVHRPASLKNSGIPKSSVKPPNEMVVFQVEAEMPRPKMGISLSSLHKSHNNDHISLEQKSPESLKDSYNVKGGATEQPLVGNDYVPRTERAETPVWQLRSDNSDSLRLNEDDISMALNEDDSFNMSKLCEAPTLERGRDGLLKNLELSNQASDKNCVSNSHSDFPPQRENQKLRGYRYPGESSTGSDCIRDTQKGQNDLPPLHEISLKETSLGAQGSDHMPKSCELNPYHTDGPPLSTDDASHYSDLIPHANDCTSHPLPKEGRFQINGYISNPDSPTTDATDGHSGHTSMEAEPEYLEPIQAHSRHQPFSNRRSLQPTTSTPIPNRNFQRSASVGNPHPSSPIVNGFTTDNPPSYPAPPPPNRRLRNPRLAVLAERSNSVTRPLSGVLLNLPYQYYEDPETSNNSSRISTEL